MPNHYTLNDGDTIGLATAAGRVVREVRLSGSVISLHVPKKSLPTIPGLYKPYAQDTRFRMLRRDTKGHWSWVNFNDSSDDSDNEALNPEIYADTMVLVWAY